MNGEGTEQVHPGYRAGMVMRSGERFVEIGRLMAFERFYLLSIIYCLFVFPFI